MWGDFRSRFGAEMMLESALSSHLCLLVRFHLWPYPFLLCFSPAELVSVFRILNEVIHFLYLE